MSLLTLLATIPPSTPLGEPGTPIGLLLAVTTTTETVTPPPPPETVKSPSRGIHEDTAAATSRGKAIDPIVRFIKTSPSRR